MLKYGSHPFPWKPSKTRATKVAKNMFIFSSVASSAVYVRFLGNQYLPTEYSLDIPMSLTNVFNIVSKILVLMPCESLWSKWWECHCSFLQSRQ